MGNNLTQLPISKDSPGTLDEKLNKVMEVVAESVAKLCLEFGMDYKQIHEHLTKSLVKETKRQHPEYSNVQIAARCGVDRRYVAKYLSEKEVEQSGHLPNNKIRKVFTKVEAVLNMTKTNRLIKFGGTMSFNKICEEITGGTLTPHSVASELIRRGLMTEDGDYYKLHKGTYIADKNNGPIDFLIPYIRALSTLTTTVIDNYRADKHGLKKIHRTVYSTQIPPEKTIEALDLIRRNADQFIDKTRDQIDELETTVDPEKYSETGFFVVAFSEELYCPIDINKYK